MCAPEEDHEEEGEETPLPRCKIQLCKYMRTFHLEKNDMLCATYYNFANRNYFDIQLIRISKYVRKGNIIERLGKTLLLFFYEIRCHEC